MGQVLLRNKFYVLIAFIILNACDKVSKSNIQNDVISTESNIQNFIPNIVKGKKYTSITPMSIIFEDTLYVVRQYDYNTFIIKDKSENTNYCFKYSGGDNVYLTKNIKPAVIFFMNNGFLPKYGILFEKNNSNNDYNFLKFEYIDNKVYKLSYSKKEKDNILNMKISDLKKIFNNMETKNINFMNKTEMPDYFYKNPLWEISW